MVASSSVNLKWMHKLVTVDFGGSVDADDVTYQVEDFFDTDKEATVRDVEIFLDTHSHSSVANLKDFFVQDIMLPIEHAMRCGVRDVDASDDEILEFRRRKALFILTTVIPRMFVHKNFATQTNDLIAHGLTRMLKILVELSESIIPDEDNVTRQIYFFRAKEFLASVSLQIWSVCMYENGIPVINAKAIPLLRKLAMLDCLDPNWNYAGGFEMVLRLLEERMGRISRISSDRLLQESTDVFRLARNAIRCQIIEFSGLEKDAPLRNCLHVHRGTNISTTTLVESASPRQKSSCEQSSQMCAYFPKCSAYFCSDVETPQNPHRRRCYRCHFYHWCSPACQEYSDQVTEQHPNYCQVCPEDEAYACRSQMQEYLNLIPHEEEAEESICCHGCGIAKAMCKQPMARCEVCMAVNYCSKTCQEWDWHCGGHAWKCESPL
jgi:hypothetical protein